MDNQKRYIAIYSHQTSALIHKETDPSNPVPLEEELERATFNNTTCPDESITDSNSGSC